MKENRQKKGKGNGKQGKQNWFWESGMGTEDGNQGNMRTNKETLVCKKKKKKKDSMKGLGVMGTRRGV